MLNAVEGLLIVARTVVKATVQIIVEAAHSRADEIANVQWP